MKSKIILIILVCIFVSLPVLVFAQEFSPQVNIPDSNQFTPGEKVEVTGNTFANYLIAIYNWGIRVIIVLAVVMIMVGGFMWMTAGGSSQRVSKAKERITSAIIGLILALGSYTLLNFINPELVAFRNLRLTNVSGEETPEGCEVYTDLEPPKNKKFCDKAQGCNWDGQKCVKMQKEDYCFLNNSEILEHKSSLICCYNNSEDTYTYTYTSLGSALSDSEEDVCQKNCGDNWQQSTEGPDNLKKCKEKIFDPFTT